MEHIVEYAGHKIEVMTEHVHSSYGIPVLVVDGDIIMQVPLTKQERNMVTARLSAGTR